jgi:glutaredoxin
MKTSEFIVYGRPNSDATGRLREFLDDRGVTYEYVNIEEDPEAERFLAVNTSEIPTLVLGPEEAREIVSNPSLDALDEVLNQYGYRDVRPDLDGRDNNPERF